MKLFFILIFFSFILATSQDHCIGSLFLPELKDGKEVWPNTCVDGYDGRKHLIGSSWNTDHGYHCECRRDGSHCCKRHDDVPHRPGCFAMANPETCGYDFYKVDAPFQHC